MCSMETRVQITIRRNNSRREKGIPLLIITTLILLVFGVMVGMNRQEAPIYTAQVLSPTDTSTPTVPTSTSTPGTTLNAEPIYSAVEAIHRAEQVMPPDFYRESTGVVLTNYDNFESWSGRDANNTDSEAPVWLVGFEGEDFDFNDVAYALGFVEHKEPISSATARPVPIPGVYYYFDANGGHLAGVGVLTGTSPFTVDGIRALETVPATIVPATDLAPVDEPTETPTASPTP